MSIPLFQEIDENSKNLDFLILYLENYFSPKAKKACPSKTIFNLSNLQNYKLSLQINFKDT